MNVVVSNLALKNPDPAHDTCGVCGHATETIHSPTGNTSLTSLCTIVEAKTVVSFCKDCGHLQSPALPDLGSFYGEAYRILLASEEEDQLVTTKNGRPIFRSEAQTETLIQLVDPELGARVLDFGCAKAATMRHLAVERPDIAVYLFDVSDMYRGYWDTFVAAARTAVHELPKSFKDFDVVTSFYSLEHIVDARGAVQTMVSRLRDGGKLCVIVPNALSNVADFIVVDHVHHFTPSSLRRLAESAGLTVRTLDTVAHDGAIVMVAEKRSSIAPRRDPSPETFEELATLRNTVSEIASYWATFADRVREFEANNPGPAAIYGSGFYGSFIRACLANPERVTCYLDRNPHRQGQTLFERPVFSPEKMPQGVATLYVGLNPSIARTAIAETESVASRRLTAFYP